MKVVDLFEAPIVDFNMVGDWEKSSSFRNADDRKLLTNPKAVQKIYRKWNGLPVDVAMTFVNMPGAGKFLETGIVTPEWLKTNLPKVASKTQIREDAINIIYTNNTGAERVPMTAWIIAHRLGHAIDQSFASGNSLRNAIDDWDEVRDEIERTTSMLLSGVYDREVPENTRSARIPYSTIEKNEPLLRAFFQAIGTFRSAREGKLRNSNEFRHELLAQYITTGKIRFNPLPKEFGFGRKAWGNHTQHARRSRDTTDMDMDYFNRGLEDFAETLEEHFENVLHRCVGKIIVM